MKRNALVLGAMALALALMIAAGVVNYEQRVRAERDRQAAHITLVPDSGSGAPSDADAAAEASAEGAMNTTPLNGKMAPAFTLEDLEGKQVSLKSYRGRPLVVDFWATWCGPCKVEIPWFVALHDQYASQGLEILGISDDDLDKDDPAKLFTQKKDIADFAKKMHMNYPILLDAESIANPYGGLDGLPTTFFIDRTGKIVASTVGLAPRDEIEADIKKAMGAAS